MSYGYRACPDCGAAVQRTTIDQGQHVCDPDRWQDHQALLARNSLAHLEQDLDRYLRTPAGMFDQFLARRGVAA